MYLNDVACWRCVPANVWRYTIGGYLVIKKWLSYRGRALLARDLRPEEARYVTETVCRSARADGAGARCKLRAREGGCVGVVFCRRRSAATADLRYGGYADCSFRG
ncbi:MAG: hypothetical protein KGZ40_00520 [Clostridiales bacterium]|nr:hypothetical protein [Clostridiales bacterium]